MDITLTLPDDLAGLDEAGLRQTLADIDGLLTTLLPVRTRCATLIETPAQVAEINSAYLDARDGTPPDTGQASDWPAYRQPTGAHDAYPAGRAIRWADGRLYRAVRSGVAHSPAEYPADWADVTAELTGVAPPETPTAAEWSIITAYEVDDLVTYEGLVYRCIRAHGTEYRGTWRPPATGVWELAV